MSRFVDDPDLLLPAFEPRFGLRRLIEARGGVWDIPVEDGILSPAPAGLSVDSVHTTLLALDPLLLALIVAGYDPRQAVVARSDFGSPSAQQGGFMRISLRSGLAAGEGGNWVTAFGLVDPGTFRSIIAIEILGWRTTLDPPVVPVSLASLPGFQHVARPSDPESTAADGWIILGAVDDKPSSLVAANAVPAATRDVVALIQRAMAATPEPGLVRILDPATWDVPRRREAPADSLLLAAEGIWELALRDPDRLQGFIGATIPDDPDDGVKLGFYEYASKVRELLQEVSPPSWRTLLMAIDDELETRRRLSQPLEGSIADVLSNLARTHWLVALIQLHEFGLVDLLPVPAPSPPAIPVIDLTGFYSSLVQVGGEVIATMQINQAGDELRGWWVDDQLEIWPITGTFDRAAQSAGRFQWNLVSTFDGSTGTLTTPQFPARDPSAFGGHVVWVGDSITWSMARRTRNARVSPVDVVAQLGEPALAAVLEPLMMPIHRVHRDRIVILADALYEAIVNASDAIDSAHLAMEAMNGAMVSDVERLDLATRQPDGTYPLTPLLVRVRAEVRHLLARRTVASVATDAWSQLCYLVAKYPVDTPDLRVCLGVSAGHTYTYTLAGVGVEGEAGAILGGVAGGWVISSFFTHSTDCEALVEADPGWTDGYSGVMAVGGPTLGFEGGGDVHFTFVELSPNTLVTVDEWARDDFLCWFVLGEFAVDAGYYTPVGGGGAGYEFVEGYTFIRPRDGVTASGRGDGPFVQVGGAGAKFGVGGSLVGAFGRYLWRDGRPSLPPPPPDPPPQETIQVRGADTATAYFAVDSAALTDAAKRVLKDLVLDYRPVLDDAGTYLVLEGHASRTAESPYNVDLSRRRMLSIYDYIHSLLTAPAIGIQPASCALAVRDSHVTMTAYGESRAEWAKLPDEVEHADYRRATVVVSGRFVASFHSAAVLVTPDDLGLVHQ